MYKIFLILFSMVFVNLISKNSFAATYYVATTGSNSYSCAQAQSKATPKATINAALNCVGFAQGGGANQTVEVADGVYPDEFTWNRWPTGTSWAAPFTLKAANRGSCGTQIGGCKVTVRPTTGICNGRPCRNMEIGDTGQNMFIIIDGFLLDGSYLYAWPLPFPQGSGDNIKYYGNYIKVRYSAIDHGAGSCIIGSGDYAEFTNMMMGHCSDNDMAYHNGAGHNVTYIGGSYNLFEDMVVYDCQHNELTIFNGGGPNGESSDYNTFNRVFVNGCGIGIYSGIGNVISNSFVMNNTRAPLWYGAGTEGQSCPLGSGQYGGKCSDSSGLGMTASWGCRNCKILNNTIFNNPDDYCIWINEVGNYNVEVKNNICWGNGKGIVNGMAGGGGAIIANNYVGDPKFVNPITRTGFIDPRAGNFFLQASSPAINTGANLSSLGITNDLLKVARPQGGAYDIGAFEYTGSSTPPPIEPPPPTTSASITVSSTSVAPGATVTVTVANGPGNVTDWKHSRFKAYIFGMPNISYLVITDKNLIYSLIPHRGYQFNNFATMESLARDREKDELAAFRGIVGDRPEMFFRINLNQAGDFISAMKNMRSTEDWKAFRDRFGIRRNSANFWPTLDFIHEWAQRQAPLESGLLDVRNYDVAL